MVHRRPRRALVVVVTLASALARAQQQPAEVPSFDVERLTLNAGAVHGLLVNTGDGLDAKALRVALALHYAHDQLVFAVNGNRIGAVIGSRFSTYLTGAYGVVDWFEVGAQLPVVWAQGGDDLTSRGVAKPAATALGAPWLQGRFTLMRESKQQPIDLGVLVGLTLPLGSSSALTKDPGAGVAGTVRVGGGRRIGWARVGGELGLLVREASVLSPASVVVYDEVGTQLMWAVMASTVGSGLRGELSVRGVLPVTQSRGSVEVMVGGRYAFVDGAFDAFVLAGPGFGITPGTPAFRVVAGLAWTPSFAPAAPPATAEPAER